MTMDAERGRLYDSGTCEELWAAYVRSPDRHPLIPNGSYAGYRHGELPIPNVPVVVDVRETGAAGNGEHDDTPALQEAIRQAAALGGGAVLVPAGEYLLKGMLRLHDSGVVLRGAGRQRTTLTFARPLAEVLGPLGAGGKSQYSWSGGLIWIGPADPFDPEGRWAGSRSQMGWEEWSGHTLLTRLKQPAALGDREVIVEDARGLQAGDTVLMCWDNPADYSLLQHMAGHPRMALYPWGEEAGDLLRQPVWKWPVELAAVQGDRVALRQPLRLNARPEWNVRLETLGPHVQEIGVEELTIRMRNEEPTDVHLQDAGFNGIYFNRALHCWARNIRLEDAQNGVIHAAAKNTSVLGLTITGRGQHHATAMRVASHDNLIRGFHIEARAWHGINTEHWSSGNVWSGGTMRHGTFDSHRALSFDVLRTNIRLHNDGRPGGAAQAGPFLGKRTVHWNIELSGSAEWVYQPDCISQGVLAGIRGIPLTEATAWAMVPGYKGCVVAGDGRRPAISDLYQAQLQLRLQGAGGTGPDREGKLRGSDR